MNINIIGHKKIFLTISGILVVAAVVLMIVFGFHEGIDFTGGALWQFRITPPPSIAEIQDFFASKFGVSETIVNFDPSSQSFLVRMPLTPEDAHHQYAASLVSQYPSFAEESF